ncbi:MAG TPA: HEAT repeat domain-containing protein [Bryobacteraceae bacterium]|jgi:anti-sigma factor RsiW|nr:HEAT repeat domain-containing protein [Bryobacteraceae bacterium]
MNCESVTKIIPLYFYGELPPEEEDRLEQHLDACAACARQAESQRALSAALDRREMQPSAALLAECRHDLMRAVYRHEAPVRRPAQSAAPWDGVRHGLHTGFSAWLPSLGPWRMPLGASALLALGFITARLTAPGAAGPFNLASLTPDVISSIRSVQPAHDGSQPGEVQIVLDETRRRVVSGQLNDSNIQRLMLAAAHDENNPGVRWESVDLLKSHSDSSAVRELLINRVAEDPNPGVRLKALDGLKTFTADPEVRKVLAQVLMHDDNPGVRIAAVDALTAHADDNMVGFLQGVVQKEDNTYVRRRCVKALQDMNASVGTF